MDAECVQDRQRSRLVGTGVRSRSACPVGLLASLCGQTTPTVGGASRVRIVAVVISQHFPFHDNGLFEAFATAYDQALVD